MTTTAKPRQAAKKAGKQENWMLRYAGILTEDETQALARHVEAVSGRKIDLGPPPKNPVRGELARKRFKLSQ